MRSSSAPRRSDSSRPSASATSRSAIRARRRSKADDVAPAQARVRAVWDGNLRSGHDRMRQASPETPDQIQPLQRAEDDQPDAEPAVPVFGSDIRAGRMSDHEGSRGAEHESEYG